MQKINNEPHPKKLYMGAQESNNLLDSKLTTIEYKPVDLNNMGEFNNSYNNQNPDFYIAEIGDKRKLSNIIYESLNKLIDNSYKNIDEYEILRIINEMNISDNKWSKINT